MNQIYKSLKQYEEGRDKNPAQIAGSLIEIGEKYQSAWLKERGKRYWEGKWDSQDYQTVQRTWTRRAGADGNCGKLSHQFILISR